MIKEIYMDNAATTKVLPEVFDAMAPYFTEEYGNASSIHFKGYSAKIAVEEAREKVSNLLNAEPEQIIFTSGATESNNWVLQNTKTDNICISEIEHDSVEKTYNQICGKEIDRAGFETPEGIVNIFDVKKLLKRTKGTTLLSIMMANNEIGTIQPIEELSKIVHQYDGIMHTDATQALGHIPVDVKMLDIDYLSASAHKFGGPNGIGCLYCKDTLLSPYMHGGHQERGLRAGTYNVPGIVGFGKACEIAKKNFISNYSKEMYLRNYFLNRLVTRFPQIKVNGSIMYRLPNIINVSFKSINGESLVLMLSDKGICCSTGSACNAGTKESSKVLQAIGVDKEYIDGTIRFSINYENTVEEIDYVIEALAECLYILGGEYGE